MDIPHRPHRPSGPTFRATAVIWATAQKEVCSAAAKNWQHNVARRAQYAAMRRIYSHFVRVADMEHPTAAMDTDDEAEAAAAAVVQQQARAAAAAAARQRLARLLQRLFRQVDPAAWLWEPALERLRKAMRRFKRMRQIQQRITYPPTPLISPVPPQRYEDVMSAWGQLNGTEFMPRALRCH
jgi:3-methyladenine DNA glycosylase/8-oxoguanine DNA glycosylase